MILLRPWSKQRMLFMLSVAGLTLGLLFSNMASQPQANPTCQNPSLSLAPNQSSQLQSAIDLVPSGGVIFLQPGTYYRANLLINKNLTLCGAGLQQTILQGNSSFSSVVRLFHPKDTIEVTIEDLAVTNGGEVPQSGIYIAGRAKVNLRNLKISDNRGPGINAADQTTNHLELSLLNVEVSHNHSSGIVIANTNPKVTLRDVLIASNGPSGSNSCLGVGLNVLPSVVGSDSSYTFENVQFIGNGCDGLAIGGKGSLIAHGLRALNNAGSGISLAGLFTAGLNDVQIDGNGKWGIFLSQGFSGVDERHKDIIGAPQLTIQQARISNNGHDGLWIIDSALLPFSTAVPTMVNLQNVTIEANGTRPECLNAVKFSSVVESNICSGLEVFAKAQITLSNSTIRRNTDWGIATYLKKCGYDSDLFSGKIVLEGTNVIEGNNTAGHQKGEVCLP